jgi:hypothetical protein
MQNFSSLSCTQTDLIKFLTIFEENSRIFQENTKANSKNFQIWVCNFLFNLAKHVHAKFQLSSLYSDELKQIFELFSRNIQDFQIKFRIFQIWEKFWIEIPKRRLLPNFEQSSIFKCFQNWFQILLTPEFLKEFQNFKILSMRYTKLAQMRLVAKISAF